MCLCCTVVAPKFYSNTTICTQTKLKELLVDTHHKGGSSCCSGDSAVASVSRNPSLTAPLPTSASMALAPGSLSRMLTCSSGSYNK